MGVPARDAWSARRKTPVVEKIVRLGIKRIPGWLYFINKRGSVMRASMIGARKDGCTPMPKLVYHTGIKKEPGYLYFLDKKGDVSRAKMVVIGKPYQTWRKLMPKNTKRRMKADQSRLSLDELKYSPKAKTAGEFLTFAVSIAIEVFYAIVMFTLGRKFWNRLSNEAARHKEHPFSYAAGLVLKRKAKAGKKK